MTATESALRRLQRRYERAKYGKRTNTVECPRCGEVNKIGASFCQNCGLAMDQDLSQEIQENEEIARTLYDGEVSAEGGLEALVREMVEKRLKEILGDSYRPKTTA